MEKIEYLNLYNFEENHWWFKGQRKILLNLIEKYFPIKKNLKIVDAGCGAGYNILILRKYGKVLGIDNSYEAIKFCKLRGIKDATFVGGATPRDNYYGRQGIFDLAKNPKGKDIHHDVMKFLEEAGLYLLCHVTSNDFGQMLRDTHPEGHDPCEDAGIALKLPFST